MTKSPVFARWFLPCAVFVFARIAVADSPVADTDVVSFVNERVDQWWLKPEERRFDAIGWADDLRTAQRLAAEHQRPVFLFTMDGRVNTGRC